MRLNCSICKQEIEAEIFPNGEAWTEGHNAQPINDGRCCKMCNYSIVLPTRMERYFTSVTGEAK
jgi:hypothetical protein